MVAVGKLSTFTVEFGNRAEGDQLRPICMWPLSIRNPLAVVALRFPNPDGLPLKLCWLVVSVLALYLLWHGAYPPYVDAANVAYSGEVLHDIWQGGTSFAQWHATRPGAVSHLAFYKAYHVLRFAFAPVVCIKLLATFSVFAPAVTMNRLLRRMKRGPWLSLPALALGFNTNLGMGFLPFAVGIFLLPLALLVIEANSARFRCWRLLLLGCVLLLSPVFHYFLTAVLLPVAVLWSALSLRGRSRLWTLAIEIAVGALIVLAVSPGGPTPAVRDIIQWVPYVERWEQLDRDVFKWTLDGATALSFPWLVLAFVSSLVLSRTTPTKLRKSRAARAPMLLLALFLGYMLGPSYISWPEPAWGLGARIAIAMAFALVVVPTTSATGWRRFFQHSPWVAFTFWHLCSLVAPFQAYDELTRPLKSLAALVPRHSKVLPVIGATSLKAPNGYSFGGFAGAACLHIGKWLAVETQSYQPWSFCDAGYHPVRCLSRLPAPSEAQSLNSSAVAVRKYDFVVAFDNAPRVNDRLRQLPLLLVHREGLWTLWRVTGDAF